MATRPLSRDEVAGPLIASVGRLAARDRIFVQVGIDWLAWICALVFATLARHDFSFARSHVVTVLTIVVPTAFLAQLVLGVASGLYRRRWRYGSFEEIAVLVRTAATTTVFLFGANLVSNGWFDHGTRVVPGSVPVTGGVAAMSLMMGARYLWRLEIERRHRPDGDRARRALVFGAGDAADQVVRAMLHDPDSPYLPVGLIDDHPAMQNMSIKGVRVLGDRTAMVEVARRLRADTVILAIPSAGAGLVRDVWDRATGAGLAVKVLPTVAELIDGRAAVEDLRSPTIADLLGRREIETDVDRIAGYLTGRRVLVTGAGGSIGSELCRQIVRFSPSELIMLDRDESALHGLELSLDGHGLLQSPDLVLADIRDRAALDRIFAQRRPEVVFHAAALKHLPMLELHPQEAVKTNLWGTLNVLDAAMSHDVRWFVNISTDKAADPRSVLGYSKRLGERLTAAYSLKRTGTYLSVRFGNVLGSRGSMLESFQAQVAAGGPVTVTHPDVRRYFMTVEEAVQLVIQAGALGRAGQALVFDMGEPVRILDVARQLISESGRRLPIVFTGLRPGEKLDEVLLGEGEPDLRPEHPLISHVDVPPIHPQRVRAIDLDAPVAEVTGVLAELSGSVGLRLDDLDRIHLVSADPLAQLRLRQRLCDAGQLRVLEGAASHMRRRRTDVPA